MIILFWILIGWFGLGCLVAMVRLMEDLELFYKCSLGQVTLLSIIYGPAWLLIGSLWIVYLMLKLTFNKFLQLWELLSEIGPR